MRPTTHPSQRIAGICLRALSPSSADSGLRRITRRRRDCWSVRRARPSVRVTGATERRSRPSSDCDSVASRPSRRRSWISSWPSGRRPRLTSTSRRDLSLGPPSGSDSPGCLPCRTPAARGFKHEPDSLAGTIPVRGRPTGGSPRGASGGNTATGGPGRHGHRR